MKSISETDGLDREQRLAKVSRTIPLRVLEDDFPALLSRALRLASGVEVRPSGHAGSVDFATLYQYQPLVVLSTIENLDVYSLEETFRRLSSEEAKKTFIASLLSRLNDARKRLEYACMATAPLLFLQDLRLQLGLVQRNDTAERELAPMLTAIRELQKKADAYREEITSSGQMDPSLAVLAAFLSNYAGVAARFNRRWQDLPAWYISQVLSETHRPESPGTAWLTYTGDEETLEGYRLFTPLQPTSLRVEQIDLLRTERRKERYPEAALGYVTSLQLLGVKPGIGHRQANRFTPSIRQAPAGFILRSPVFLLGGGERHVTVSCTLTPESMTCFDTLIGQLVQHDGISACEALYKVLNDSFVLSVTTAQGWQEIDHFTLRLHRESRELRFCFLLGSDFPPMCGETENELPAISFLLSSTAWLYPYSWSKQMQVEGIAVDVRVEGLREGVFYNELGLIDTHQSFAPFGMQNERGAWIAFGSYEMACKRVTEIKLDFNWQQIPRCAGGLYEYYKGYPQGIDNRSFRVRTEYLQNGQWKPTPGEETHYLFRTEDSLPTAGTSLAASTTASQPDAPQTDGLLSESSYITFTAPGLTPLPSGLPDHFRPGLTSSGFYRLVFASPDMGFGDKEYRRLFAGTMLHNAHSRRKVSPPEEPLTPRWEAPVLSYTAHEECTFAVGVSPVMQLEYITPFSVREAPDTSRPVPLIQGPDDEALYLFTLSGAEGENSLLMYVEMEPLQREIDHRYLPETSWFYDNGIRWVKIPPSNLLRDETGGWMHSGVVQVLLPVSVSPEMLDESGYFRIGMAVHRHFGNCASLRTVYFNIVQAEAISASPEELLPLTGYRPISSLIGKVPRESDAALQLRVSERVNHRQRALLPRDYEQMVLQEFPELRKVKCLPGIDAKGEGRSNLVTLVLVGEALGTPPDKCPLCEDRLLCAVEQYLASYTSPFTEIDAINPVYEEVTVFCGVSLAPGQTTGSAIDALRRKIHACIAPWYDAGGTPLFAHSFSLHRLQDTLREHPVVSNLHGIKIVHLVTDGDGRHLLNEYLSDAPDDQRIAPSSPWSILIPAVKPYIILCTAEEWQGEVQFGDLELEQTFVIA